MKKDNDKVANYKRLDVDIMGKLSKADVETIRIGIQDGRSYQELADQFDVSRNCIWNIKHNKIHVGVGPDVSRKRVKKKISKTKKMSICTALSMGETQKKIAKRLNVSQSTIAQVKKESAGNKYGIDVSSLSKRKLSEKDVKEIRRRIKAGEKGAALAREFEVTRTHISDIKNGKCWNTEDKNSNDDVKILSYEMDIHNEKRIPDNTDVQDEETERNFKKLMDLCSKTKK
ncbi:MAG: hypothetical protein NE328_17420 [Lentisphaeraceae bacterium]|nr:hypothetical protein [Lentisphaeraceae bacterium]